MENNKSHTKISLAWETYKQQIGSTVKQRPLACNGALVTTLHFGVKIGRIVKLHIRFHIMNMWIEILSIKECDGFINDQFWIDIAFY